MKCILIFKYEMQIKIPEHLKICKHTADSCNPARTSTYIGTVILVPFKSPCWSMVSEYNGVVEHRFTSLKMGGCYNNLRTLKI